ncbi:DUF3592 domain-containing protein [Vaginella massiliensis]|uniref:hypothetical protein n=1 Tax=Vaginella massiliensis TaxID=1816680 RepID=UPI0012B66022|nr:hypothetical protein [Vaginella massiliensis]
MSSKFWQWYILGFFYIFPLFFCFAGVWNMGPWLATLSLLLGIVGWIWLVVDQFRLFFKNPNRLLEQVRQLQRNGKVVDAKIRRVISKKQSKDGDVFTELYVSFPNFSGTEIFTTFEMYDSKPHENRFEVGKTFPLRLNTSPNTSTPWVIGDGEYFKTRSGFRWLFLFSIVYAVVVFIVNYYIFTDDNGWRWLSFFHPWVWIPYTGVIFYNRFLNKFLYGDDNDQSYKLYLYGLETTGQITKSSQTGLYINEQPQMRIQISYTDKNGKTHFVEKKQIVMLSDLHNYQVGDVKLLYLPDNPETIELL